MASTRCLICNCEKTMPLDEKKLTKAMGQDIEKIHVSLCRAQLESYEKALQSSEELIVACTQESPLFQEIVEENDATSKVRFVNIRENAGWSEEAEKAHPKIAALLEDAEYEAAPARLKSVQSDGMCLVYGSGQKAMEVARFLSERLSVTLLLSDNEDLVLPPLADIPIYRGDIVQASGSFGFFEITVDNYAPLRPASRNTLDFAIARNGAMSNCSLIFDLSGKTPLFPGHRHRDGYTHVDPDDAASVLREVIRFSDMAGEFEKPIYVDYNADTCAHSRSQKTGCNKCLDVCPAGAITDAGDIVEIDSGVCGGCGSCHSVCPTGSISYQYPARTDIIGRSQNVLSAYTNAGGKEPFLLLHEAAGGAEMISAVARYGKGLPANAIPLGFHTTTTFGHVELLGMIASGAAHIMILTNPERKEELTGLEDETALANEILGGLELAEKPRIEIICESDPEIVEQKVWNLPGQKAIKPSSFQPIGGKREIGRIIFAGLHEQSKAKPDSIVLPDNAPYGRLDINETACTLCMACTSACPANAITDTPGEPKLRFTEAACVQCGLCVNTCPEKALSLVPQLDFTPAAMQPRTLYEEEPFECISCGKPFATKSTIERISDQLAGKHSMFANEERSNLIKMCEDCRIEVQANSSEDPFVVGSRPKPRTTEDYLAAEKGDLTVDDFLMDD
ncbi:MAG: 4Fe-4S binding protein [Pseudomonadota bacterium]